MNDKEKDKDENIEEMDDEFEEEDYEDEEELEEEDFIDEDEFEEEIEEKVKPKKVVKRVKKKPAKRVAPIQTERPQLDIVWVAILVVVAFMVGFFIRGLFTAPAQQQGINTQSPGGSLSAPPLSPEQMQNGELPPGHPGTEDAPAQEGTDEDTKPSSEDTANP